jgi:hypothetical protein
LKKRMLLACILILGLLISLPAASWAITWHAWAVHDGSINATSVPGQITSTLTSDLTYHWNKSNWSTRTGQKAYYSTSDFNGMTVGSILSVGYQVTSGNWGNVYFNVYVQDSNGKRAILSPSYNSAAQSGWAAAGNSYCVFEAESGWTGTAKTGWYAATWDQVKNLTISTGGPLELPDTVNSPHATVQNDTLYQSTNWTDWAKLSGVEQAAFDGFAIIFGQSTSSSAGVTIKNFQVTAVPLPASLLLLGSGLVGLGLLRRRRIVKR